MNAFSSSIGKDSQYIKCGCGHSTLSVGVAGHDYNYNDLLGSNAWQRSWPYNRKLSMGQ